MITHTCGSIIPPDIETYVRHLASCPETWDVAAGICQGIVNAVEHEVANGETSRKTRAVSRDISPARMQEMRDVAEFAGVAPETVRRRIKKWKRSES